MPAAGESPTGNLTIPASTDPTTWPAESSVCFLLALRQGRQGITFSEDKLPPGSLATTIGNLKQLVDAWGQPLVFYRWPAMNTDVDNSSPLGPYDPTNRKTWFRDVQDPEGFLLDPTWNNGNTAANSGNWFANWPNDVLQGYPQGVWWFELYCHPIHDSASAAVYNYARSYYMVPVIASAGPNGRLGLVQQPWMLQGPIPPPLPFTSPLLPDLMSIDPNDSNGADDNIYSYRLRLGARGD